MRLFPRLRVRSHHFGYHRHPAVNEEGEIVSGLAKWSKQYANLPERYMLRKARKVVYVSPPDSAFKSGITLSKIPDFTMDRPWEDRYWMSNRKHAPAFSRQTFVEPIRDEDWMWFKGDRVEILTGRDKGKQGYINYIVQERNWVCVEGLNCEFKTVGENKNFPGMMYMSEKPLVVTTDIKLVDPEDERPTEIEWRYTDDGETVRVSTRTGRIIPLPSEAFETVDYKTPAGYSENKSKDTPASVVEDITFVPQLCTFEMDIMELQNIKEDRVPKRTFWY